VHGFVHGTQRNGLRRGRRPSSTWTRATRSPTSARALETARDRRDGRRTAHNPEVAGSNPAPATKAEAVSRTERRPLACGWPGRMSRPGRAAGVCYSSSAVSFFGAIIR
jgi:hypothetical protein